MTDSTGNAIRRRISEIAEREKKASAGPWSDSWTNDVGAGVTGPSAAALCCGSLLESPLPIVTRPNAIKQSDKQEAWYGEAIARTYEKSDAEFIAHARADIPFLLSELAAPASPGPRPVCPKCQSLKVNRVYAFDGAAVSMKEVTDFCVCPSCNYDGPVAQFFPASLNGEKRAPEPCKGCKSQSAEYFKHDGCLISKVVDMEQSRWQKAIYGLCRKHAISPEDIDGSGCDSGDPLDLTLTEIGQVICQLENPQDYRAATTQGTPEGTESK